MRYFLALSKFKSFAISKSNVTLYSHFTGRNFSTLRAVPQTLPNRRENAFMVKYFGFEVPNYVFNGDLVALVTIMALLEPFCNKTAFCNKISILPYSSNIDPQTSKRMWMWIKCVCKLCCKRTFYYKNGSICKQKINCNTKTALSNKF